MKKLNKKEMSKATGGYYTSTTSREEMQRHEGTAVGMYDGWVGNTYVFENIGTEYIMIGKLIDTYERDGGYGSTVRTHEVQVIDALYRDEPGTTVYISGSAYRMFEYID